MYSKMRISIKLLLTVLTEGKKETISLPLQRKITRVGASRWVQPPIDSRCRYQSVGICKASRTQRECQSTQRNTNTSRWNIGRVWSPRIGACIGHVDFMLFVSISCTLDSQREHSFWWNMGLSNRCMESV